MFFFSRNVLQNRICCIILYHFALTEYIEAEQGVVKKQHVKKQQVKTMKKVAGKGF